MTKKYYSCSERRQIVAMATRAFRCDMHEQHGEYREYCSACSLRGYLSESAKADGMKESDGPNVAGWARLYVQAGQPIPMKWFEAFGRELNSDNKGYAEGLKKDVFNFVVRFV